MLGGKVGNSQMSRIKITETISDTPYSQAAYCYLNDVKAVLKTKKEAIITNSIETELKIHEFLSNYDLCPDILDYDLLNNHIVYEYLKYSVENSEYDHVFLEILGKALSKLHSLNYRNKDAGTFEEKIEGYRNILSTDPTAEIQESFALFDKLYKKSNELVFCHNDLNTRNIFLNKQMKFIDWEYAGLNMPIYEIASIKKSFNFSSDQFNIFLKAYGQDFNPNEIEEFEVLVGFVEKIWQTVTNKLKSDQ